MPPSHLVQQLGIALFAATQNRMEEIGHGRLTLYDIEERRFLGTINCVSVEEVLADAIFDPCTLGLARNVALAQVVRSLVSDH
jgi:hypothetical protein